MNDGTYVNLLHELERLRTTDADASARSRRELERDNARVAEARERVETERAELTELAGRLSAAVPDLRAADDPTDPAGTLDAELAAATAALDDTQRLRNQALRAAQLPPLLPRGHHFVRNLIVYAAAMIACFVVQVVLFGLQSAGVLPADIGLWIVFIPPLLFLLAGYIATSVAGSPRVPMEDAKGGEIAFTVYKSPRLGGFLAVLTMAAALIWMLR